MTDDAAIYVPHDLERLSGIQYTQHGNPLLLDVYRLRGVTFKRPQPALIWLHGGGWMSGDRERGVERIFGAVRAGFVGVSVDYRLSQTALFPAQIHDCKCAVRFLRAQASQFNVDPNRIGAWGASAGGHLSALLATNSELEGDGGWAGVSSGIQAACSWFGPTDFHLMDSFTDGVVAADPTMDESSPAGRLVGGAVAERPELVGRANPIRYITPACPPILLMHGARDTYVPLACSTEFHRCLRAAGVDSTLHVIRDGHHNAYLWGDHHLQQVTEFFDWHLRERPTIPAPGVGA